MPEKYNINNNYILGIQIGHDSSCCLIKNGKIVYAEEEERKNRIKNYAGIPWMSIFYAIKKFKISMEEIKYIAIPWEYEDYILSRSEIIQESYLLGNINYGNRKQQILENFKQYISEIQNKFLNSELVFVPHHISHLYSTIPFFSNLTLENTSAIVSDAIGEFTSCSLYSSIFYKWR